MIFIDYFANIRFRQLEERGKCCNCFSSLFITYLLLNYLYKYMEIDENVDIIGETHEPRVASVTSVRELYD